MDTLHFINPGTATIFVCGMDPLFSIPGGSSPRAAVGHEPGHLLRLIAGVVPLLDSGPGIISILKSVGRWLYFSIFSKDLILYSNFAPDIGIMVLPPLVRRHQRGVPSAYRMRLCLISTQSRLINDLAAADNKQGFTGEIN